MDLPTLRRNWLRDSGEVRFTFRIGTEGYMEVSDEDVRVIADGVRESLDDASSSNPVAAEGWVGTRTGWAAVLVGAFEWDHVLEWLELFTSRWGGGSGRIRGGPASRGPLWGHRHARWELAALCAYTTVELTPLDRPERDRIWGLDAKFTQALAQRAADWTVFPGAKGYLEYGISVPTVDTDLGRPFAETILRDNSHAGVSHERRKPYRLRECRFQPTGQVSFLLEDPNVPWREKYEDLVSMLVWAPQRLDLAFIRYTRSTVFWSSPVSPDWPYIIESDFRYNRPLLAEFVPDVNGIQVLTEAHLARANDLSNWSIKSLPGGRHLVASKDIEGWYTNHEPEADLLSRARSDFGEMILTKELAEEHSLWGYVRTYGPGTD